MKFTKEEIAEIYGDNMAELEAQNNSSHIGYLMGKLERLNNASSLEGFAGNLDLRNQKNFAKVIRRKLAWLDERGL